METIVSHTPLKGWVVEGTSLVGGEKISPPPKGIIEELKRSRTGLTFVVMRPDDAS